MEVTPLAIIFIKCRCQASTICNGRMLLLLALHRNRDRIREQQLERRKTASTGKAKTGKLSMQQDGSSTETRLNKVVQ